jgi:ribonuclease P protein subunit POP4
MASSSNSKKNKASTAPWLIYFTALVGLEACILFHPNHTFRGLCGKIIRETRTCIVLEVDGKCRVCVPKKGSLFIFKLEQAGCVLVRGEEIFGTLAERLKRLERGKGVVWLVRTSKKRWDPGCKAAREDM